MRQACTIIIPVQPVNGAHILINSARGTTPCLLPSRLLRKAHCAVPIWCTAHGGLDAFLGEYDLATQNAP